MDRDEYLAQRKTLLDQTEELIKNSKISESNEKMAEIEALDNQWEESKLLNANMNALKEKTKLTNLENESIKDLKNVKEVGVIMEDNKVNEKDAYLNAWAKEMMGQKLTDEERQVFNNVNSTFKNDFNSAYTHTTVNTPTLIPETVVAGIWKRAEEQYPMVADVRKYSVSGTLTINKHTAINSGDAAWYQEAAAIDDEQNTFAQVTLSGCELAKAITVSWKLKSMAIAEFIPYIERELGERVGVVIGNALYSGSGVAGQEPEGIITALNAEANTPQKVTYTIDSGADPLDYAKLTEAMSKIHSSYLSGVAIYATNATIWTRLANLMDAVGRPLFIPDVTSGGVGRIFGLTVKADAGAGADNIVFANANAGYVMNTNEPLSILMEDHVKARETDYAAYTIIDGKVLDTKAFAFLDLV